MYKRLSILFSAMFMFMFVAAASVPGCEDGSNGRGPGGSGPPGQNKVCVAELQEV